MAFQALAIVNLALPELPDHAYGDRREEEHEDVRAVRDAVEERNEAHRLEEKKSFFVT